MMPERSDFVSGSCRDDHSLGVHGGGSRRSQFWSQLSLFATVRADTGTPAARSAHPKGRLETEVADLESGLTAESNTSRAPATVGAQAWVSEG